MKSITFKFAASVALALVQSSLLGAALLPPMLVVRQAGGGISSALQQCESPCIPIVNYIQGGQQQQCTIEACCSNTFEKEYFDCFTCVGNAENLTDFSSMQKNLDGLTASCLANGISLTKLTFPGQDPNRALPSVTPNTTASATGSSTQSSTVAQITITTPSHTTISTPSQSVTGTSSSNAATRTMEETFLPLVVLGLCGILLENWVM